MLVKKLYLKNKICYYVSRTICYLIDSAIHFKYYNIYLKQITQQWPFIFRF